MRNAFIKEFTTHAIDDERLMLLTADLGFKVFDDVRLQLKKRFINVGVAESFLIGAAAGMAMEGKIPFCYSIAPFLVMRPFEFIRNDICFHHANVKLVSVGGGFSYGPNGATHHALNDVALMRSLPEMTILTPADSYELTWAMHQALAVKGPVYIRLGRNGEKNCHQQPLPNNHRGSVRLLEGHDVALCVSGFILANALEAAHLLKKQGITVRLISFPSIKPLDDIALMEAFEQCAKVITIEEHYGSGGFGSIVAQSALSKGVDVNKLTMIHVPQHTQHVCGSQAYLQDLAGLSPAKICAQVMESLKGKGDKAC